MVCLNRTYDAVKTSIKRLEKKGCIIRVKFKNGRGGWSQYEVPKELYHETIQHESGYKSGSELGTTISSSSSNLIRTTTTELPDEWNFDISAYQAFGFRQSHLKQLFGDGNLTADQVEESLLNFNHDYKHGYLKKDIQSKISYLMKILRNGQEFVSDKYNDLVETDDIY
jgi:hypothetical protein